MAKYLVVARVAVVVDAENEDGALTKSGLVLGEGDGRFEIEGVEVAGVGRATVMDSFVERELEEGETNDSAFISLM